MDTLRGTPTFLDRVNVNGTLALGIRGTDHYLVQRDSETGQFQPVDLLVSNVASNELEANYGIWHDKEITKGWWFWKKTVHDADGEVQADEVSSFEQFRDSQKSLKTNRLADSDRVFSLDKAEIKIVDTDSGPEALLESEWSVGWGNSRSSSWLSPLAPPL